MTSGSPSGSVAGTFVLAGRRVDTAANTVEWAGETVHLEPRVVEVLVCLAEHDGRVVSRAELEEEVWAGTVVGYDAITQSVSKLRRALGDDSRHPGILETVAKGGYRLIAPLEPDLQPPRRAAVIGPKRDPPATVGAATLEVHAERRTFRLIWPIVALFLALSLLLIRPVQQPDSPRIAAGGPSLAVLPFENLSGGLELDYLVDGILQEVASALAAIGDIQVIAASALDERDASTEPSILARRLGARFMIGGSVEGDSGRVSLVVRLIDTATNRLAWTKHYDRDPETVLVLVDDITRHVAAVLLPESSVAAKLPLAEPDAESVSELGYDALIDSPRRLKCLYGNFAQIAGDHVTAVRIFEDCIARWNDVRSMIALAHILELGVGVPQDLTRAALLLQRGAQTNDPEGYSSLARYHYGMAVLQGSGIAPDGVEGLRWLRRAAEEGVEDAWQYLERHFPEHLPVVPGPEHGDPPRDSPQRSPM